MAIKLLKSKTIIILFDSNDELGALPAPVRDQFFILDDGPQPGGHHFMAPKVVFSNPDGNRTLGRVWYTKMKDEGEAAIDTALLSFPADPDVQTLVDGSPASEPVQPSASAPVSTAPEPAAK